MIVRLTVKDVELHRAHAVDHALDLAD